MRVDDTMRWWPGLDRTDPIDTSETGRAPGDKRKQFERERDRVLYADEFERLRGVTQVVSPIEGVLCHDRHTHSLRVEQLAHRIATNSAILASRPTTAPDELPDPWATAAAALAHDLGHPPFGHVAEDELNRLLMAKPFLDADGYEGNAQSFRILTRLGCHREGGRGLRLSQRVLRGVLKYPWLSTAMPTEMRKRKYGAYLDDTDAFRFAIGSASANRGSRSIEAAVMDAADAIAYSVHDLFDFYRAGLIDLSGIERLEHAKLLEIVGHDDLHQEELTALHEFALYASGFSAYVDTRRGRELIQTNTSHLVTSLIEGHHFGWNHSAGWELKPNRRTKATMDLMQGLTKHFVIDSGKLSVTQVGHRRVVRKLFRTFVRALWRGETRLYPDFFRDDAKALCVKVHEVLDRAQRDALDLGDEFRSECAKQIEVVQSCGRLAADTVASLSDSQALAMHSRIAGVSPLDGFLA